MDPGTYLSILKKRLFKNFSTLRPASARLKGVEPFIFQHDGAKPRIALTIDEYFDEREIEVLGWPLYRSGDPPNIVICSKTVKIRPTNSLLLLFRAVMRV